MVLSWTLFLLLLPIQQTLSLLNCGNFTDFDCDCFPSELELQCPKNATEDEDTKFVLHITTDLTIDCYNMDNFTLIFLPKFTPESLNYELKLSDCPLPSGGFKSISDYMSGVSPAVLVFEDYKDVILTKESFVGLKLKKLKLGYLSFESISEGVFWESSSLTTLEMSNNKNVTLSKKSFQNLTNLKYLYLNSNGLDDLPGEMFASLGKLQILHLWSNKLTVITDNTFVGLENLTSLDLNSNKIWNISRGAFRNFRNLSSLNLAGNQLTTLAGDIFKSNVRLKTVFLSHNSKLQLPDYLFASLKLLETVNLSRCSLTSIPDHVFENCSKLVTIILDGNKLQKISSRLFQGLEEVKSLSLEGNQITQIDEETFGNLKKLEKLNLKKNKITNIHSNALYGKRYLKVLDLAENLLETVNFGDSNHLMEVNLRSNHITDLKKLLSSENPLYNHLKLQKLNLDNNQISEVQLNDLMVVGANQSLVINLNNNNITKIAWEEITDLDIGKTTISFFNNSLQCSCDLYDFVKSLQVKGNKPSEIFKLESLECSGPLKLSGTKLEDLEPFDLTCDLEENCLEKCSCKYRPHDSTVVVDCSYKNLTKFPVIDHEFNASIELNLEHNRLTTGPKEHGGYKNVTRLLLSHNKIKRVGWLPPKLEELKLDNNDLTSLDHEVIEYFIKSNLTMVSLHGNNWMCDCAAVNLSNFLRQGHNKKIPEKVRCYNRRDFLVNLTEDKLCPNVILMIVLPIFVLILLFLVVLVLFLRFQEEIKIWLFAHNLFPACLSEEDLDKDKLYDAFISYSHKDEDFVIQNLVPVLESGPDPYKLCLHFRNWVPGEFILTQVTNSVSDSRRTLVVLSPNFLESVWGKTEFRTAHTQAMTEGRARVIIVLYGDVDVETLDNELKAYLKTNTYVKWGDPYFWMKLKYALPHSKSRNSKNNQKIANAMSCIDNKFTLVAPVTNQRSAPPVLTLDPQGLKKDLLHFVPNTETVIV